MQEVKADIDAIRKLTAVGGKRTRHRVNGKVGLLVEAFPNGKLSFQVRVQIGKGREARRRTFVTLGSAHVLTLGQARDLAAKALQRAELAKAGDATVGEVFERWRDEYARPNLKTATELERMYAKHIEGRLGHRRVSDLTRRDYIEFLSDVAADGAKLRVRANRVQVLLTSMLNWATDESIIEGHEARGITKRVKESPRDRDLDDAELAKFWHGIGGATSTKCARILRLLLLTGARLDEMVGLRRSEVREDHLEIGRARTKKQREPLVIPMTDGIAAIIKDALADVPDDVAYLFPQNDKAGNVYDAPTSKHTASHAMAKFAEDNALVRDGVRATAHDLRRTVATRLAKLGVAESLIDRLQGRLGSQTVGQKHYNRHAYFNEKRAALEAWEVELLRIVR